MDIHENIHQRLFDEYKKGKINQEKFNKLMDSYKKAHQEEAVQAAVRDFRNPDYKGPNVVIKRKEATHEDFEAVGGIDTSTAVFGQQPNILAGQENPSKIASKSKKGTQKKAMRNYKYSKLRGKKVDNINEENIDMKNIVKVMLQEGIDEETIHEVLNIISEEYRPSKTGLGIIANSNAEAENKYMKQYREIKNKAKGAKTYAEGAELGRQAKVALENARKFNRENKALLNKTREEGIKRGYSPDAMDIVTTNVISRENRKPWKH